MSGAFEGRAGREQWRRRRRRRRVVRGFAKLVFWLLVLAGVFVLGLGFGKTLADGDGGGTSHKVTIEHDRGAVTATLPVKTVTKTRTVVKTVRAKAKRRR